MAENAQGKEFNVEELLKMGKDAYDKIKNEKIEPEPTQPLNVLIAGKTGAGKSTLINAIFGKEVAPTGSGEPVTQRIIEYPITNNFSIFDTKGLEMKDFEKTLSQIVEELNKRKIKPVDEQIHIAWLCIAEGNRRVEDGEKRLHEVFKELNIPVITIITRAIQDADEKGVKFSDIVKAELSINDDKYFQRVRALEVEDDEGEIKKIMGLDKASNKGKDGLIEKTYALLSEGQKEAFARHQKHNDELRKKAETREHARALINRYSALAGGVAATPIPFSDFALLLPTQIAMITHVSNAYGLDMSADTAKKLAIAFAGVAGAGFGIKLAVGSLLKIIPGLGSLAGGAMNATIAATTTKLMGHAYLSYLDDNFDELENAISSINTDIFKEYWDKAGVLFPDDAEKIASK
ncbi:YcjF family protein [Campylobacter sp.]|uniref:YcjF family protein n=1 Tax=Campylobacter sp. TaxID=205 RepID=UPI002A7632DA|nr:DUF697 domain-containing protein [Campylobacter sp.]MDY2763772.1 DUF697 domain-containing protein [Campylobacter sp.]